MNVVFHQHIAVHLNTEKCPGLVDNPQESLPVAVVPKYRPPLIATAGYMVPGTRIFYAKGSSPDPSLQRLGP